MNERKIRYLISQTPFEKNRSFASINQPMASDISHENAKDKKKVLDNFIMSNEHCFSIYLCLMRPPIERIQRRRRRDDANRHASIDIRRIVYVYMKNTYLRERRRSKQHVYIHLREGEMFVFWSNQNN